jgi:hypothetical protein
MSDRNDFRRNRKKRGNFLSPLIRFGVPDGIRTRVIAVKGGLVAECGLWLNDARFAIAQ